MLLMDSCCSVLGFTHVISGLVLFSTRVHPCHLWIRVVQYSSSPMLLVESCCSISSFLCSVFCKSLFVILYISFGLSFSTYGFWLHLLYLETFLCNYTYIRNTIPLRGGVLDKILYDKIDQWLAAGRWFPPDTPVSSTNKTDRHDITEILLKVALNTITLTFSPIAIQ